DDVININVQLPIGTNKEVVKEYLFELQEIIEKEAKDSYETIVLNSGNSNTGSIQINLPDITKQKMSPTEIKNAITPYFSQWSDVNITYSSGRGPGGNSGGIDVKVLSTDSNAAGEVMNQIVTLLKKEVPQLTNITTDLEDGSPRFQIAINTEAASQAGVSVKSISQVLQTAITGTTATVYHTNGQDQDIVVQMVETDIQNPSDIAALTVSTPSGLMTLDNFVNFVEGRSPRNIQKENGERVNHVKATLIEGATATEVQQIVEQLIQNNIVLPETVDIDYGGDAKDIATFKGTFLVIIALAIFLVFVVMAAQFESLADPLIVFFSIPLLLIGVVAIYKITGQTLSLYSFVGIVSLVGIVVNNGIVLVDFTNQLVQEKTPVREACILAGKNRLRPILMTTLTTVLGMVPMAFFPGEGADTLQPMCLTLVGGLISGAFMTLLISPVLYYMINKRREKRFDDPESLMNQLIELDDMEGKKRISMSTGMKE
ncbi:MAG: efflux RND transporter permease subunit, partial [Spirochaetaceae bacterium]|nr:efflux RND transporter permease subunit [Spirochaetaceae bacterium]